MGDTAPIPSKWTTIAVPLLRAIALTEGEQVTNLTTLAEIVGVTAIEVEVEMTRLEDDSLVHMADTIRTLAKGTEGYVYLRLTPDGARAIGTFKP